MAVLIAYRNKRELPNGRVLADVTMMVRPYAPQHDPARAIGAGENVDFFPSADSHGMAEGSKLWPGDLTADIPFDEGVGAESGWGSDFVVWQIELERRASSGKLYPVAIIGKDGRRIER